MASGKGPSDMGLLRTLENGAVRRLELNDHPDLL